MAKKRYRVASPEGAEWSGNQLEEEVELDLEQEQERALIAAGWLELVETKKKGG